MKRTVILVDGQNLFYTLKYLGFKEIDLNWKKLFHSFLEPNDELIRAYWFRPQKILDVHYSARSIRNRIAHKNYNSAYQKFRSSDRLQESQDILDRIERDAKRAEKWLNEARAKFSNAEYLYDQLCLDNSDKYVSRLIRNGRQSDRSL